MKMEKSIWWIELPYTISNVQYVRHLIGPKHRVKSPISCRTCCTYVNYTGWEGNRVKVETWIIAKYYFSCLSLSPDPVWPPPYPGHSPPPLPGLGCSTFASWGSSTSAWRWWCSRCVPPSSSIAAGGRYKGGIFCERHWIFPNTCAQGNFISTRFI